MAPTPKPTPVDQGQPASSSPWRQGPLASAGVRVTVIAGVALAAIALGALLLVAVRRRRDEE